MPDIQDYFKGGRLQESHLDGIVSHGYQDHGVEFGEPSDFSATEYREVAEQTLGDGDRAYAVQQQNGENVLVVNDRLGAVAWVNGTHPDHSTLFVPTDGADLYVAQVLAGAAPERQREIHLDQVYQQIRAEAKPRNIADERTLENSTANTTVATSKGPTNEDTLDPTDRYHEALRELEDSQQSAAREAKNDQSQDQNNRMRLTR